MPKQQQMLPTIPKQVIKALGLAITLGRKETGWSQSNLAERIGVSRQKVARLEKGDPKIDVGTLITAAWLLNVPLIKGLDFSSENSKDFLSLLSEMIEDKLNSKVSVKRGHNHEDF